MTTTNSAHTPLIALRSGRILDPLQAHVPQARITSITDITNFSSDDKCPICMDVLATPDTCSSSACGTEQVYKIPECGHRFHISCLMQWFRCERRCPMCRDDGLDCDNRNLTTVEAERRWWPCEQAREGRIKLIKQMCRRKNAPAMLVKIMNRRDVLVAQRINVNKELRIARRPKSAVIFKQQESKIHKLQDLRWKIRGKIRKADGELSCFKVTEIIITKQK